MENKVKNVVSESVLENAEGVVKNLVVWVLLDQLPKVEQRIGELNKLIAKNKLELSPITIEKVSPVYEKVVTKVVDGESRNRRLKAVDVTIKGSMPKIPDYEMVAMIEKPEDKMTKGFFINHVNKEFPYDKAWETHDLTCDHCGTKRRRNEIYILNHKPEGRLKAVGRSCLEEFLPKRTLKSILQFCSDWEILTTEFHMDLDFGYRPALVQTSEALAMAICIVERDGFISQSSAKVSHLGVSTADCVRGLLFDAPDLDEATTIIKQEHRALAELAHSKVGEYLKDVDDQSYANNLRVAVSTELIGPSKIGLLCAFALEVCKAEKIKIQFKLKEERADYSNSKFQGQVGERISRRLTVINKVQFESFNQFSRDGMSTVFTLVDEEGNQYVIFPTNFNHEIGYEFIGKATVKAHKAYTNKREQRTINQTVLTRLTIENDAVINRGLQQLEGITLSAKAARSDKYNKAVVVGDLVDEVLRTSTEFYSMTNVIYAMEPILERFYKGEVIAGEKIKTEHEIGFRGKFILKVESYLESDESNEFLKITQKVAVKGMDKIPKW